MQLEQLEKFFPTAYLQKYFFKLKAEAGGLAQMVERALRKCEVALSMPASSNTKYFQHNSFRKARKIP